MEVRVLAHDEQSFTMLRHITKYPEFHMLIGAVPSRRIDTRREPEVAA